MRKFFDELKTENGNLVAIAITEFFVYFCSAFGFSDYVFNTAIYKKTGWVEDSLIPGTLVTAYSIPGIFIAIAYFSNGLQCELLTLILCVVTFTAGAIIGSHVATNLDVSKLKRVIGYAMIFSMIALIIKLIVSSGVAGIALGLKPWQFVIVLPCCFGLGILNMLGVPMKPPLMSLLLLLGLAPITTLTILMTISVPGPISGSINFFKTGKYKKKVFVCAATLGSIAAIIGGRFALNINTYVLTIVMLVAMAYVSYTMLKK